MLVHICCSVDCDYFLRRLKELTQEPLICYFYDPNIHPYGEYVLRMHDSKRVCENLGIKFIPGEYNFQGWLQGARGLENEPEKGSRCEFCFDFRMQKTAELALSLGERKITTTLLMSPKKSHSQLCGSLQRICERYGLEFIAPDFRKNGGTNEQFALAKKDALYHQNYCGCIYALAAQRNDQRKTEQDFGGILAADFRRNLAPDAEIYELMSPIDRQILPASVEEKLKFYKKLCSLEKNGVKFSVLRDRFLNYRLLRAWIKFDGEVVPSFVLFGSHFTRENVKFSVERECEIFCSDKGEIKILSLAKFNEISRSNFKSVSEMLKKPPSLARQNKARAALCAAGSLSPIIVTDEIRGAKVQIYGLSRIFLDVREILVRI
ncbi:MAG: epoxyqueuosine reductase QueH [Campylobacter gracilis]|uniref:epoxyqueuosine reductase QueH n=1 Tax=Campylobacter gracilis TaxID=824 RepID=UPI0026F27A83|nr:epoxyqueuosine reductase QueH [Campylobacter gracilis]MBS6152948.1 epoxyqueuosine reductase QueH [Campylobacter gracilis]